MAGAGDVQGVARGHASAQRPCEVEQAALRHLLRPAHRPGARFKLRLLTKKGLPVRGVNVADRGALYERMEGRD
jgi:hypothetical protein